MQIVKNAQGKLETTGSADADAKSEAKIRAQIAVQRAELRRMLEGNAQFFDDPTRKPEETLPTNPSLLEAQLELAGAYWKLFPPPIAGVYTTRWQGNVSLRHWNGVDWSQSHYKGPLHPRQDDSHRAQGPVEWQSLVLAD